jgi:hypothetical protein|tara:strand:+ start:350 stop:670 length:321 start_codon:yes stop_codon:yes gene_type:complete
MKTSPTKDEAAADEWLLSRETERALTEEACLQFEIKLISLEHVLYNQTVDKYHFNQNDIRKICTNITKLREHVKREYSLLDRAISKVVSHKWIFESEDPGLDEIIN